MIRHMHEHRFHVEEHTYVGNILRGKLFLSVGVDDTKMVGRREMLGPVWAFLGDPTLLLDQLLFGSCPPLKCRITDKTTN